MTLSGSRTPLVLGLLLAVTGGCYRYVPSDVELAPPGDDVRILVTRQGASQLNEVAPGAAATGMVSGKLERVEGDDLLLSVPVGERREGFMTIDMTQTIRVPRGEILNLESKEFDTAGTALVVAAAAAIGTGIVFGIIEGFGNTPPPDEGDPPVDFRFVLGRLALPFGW